MGKIVKFCSACEESFAEKFSYCPNCAAELSAFEMNPVSSEPVADRSPEPEAPAFLSEDEPVLEVPGDEPQEVEVASEDIPAEPVREPEVIPAETEASAPEFVEETAFETEPSAIAQEMGDEWVAEEPAGDSPQETVAFDGKEAGSNGVNGKKAAEGTFLGLLEVDDKSYASDTGFEYDPEDLKNYNYDIDPHDENYKVTVISEKSSSVRNGLLLGAFFIFAFGFLGLIAYSLFNNLSEVSSLVDDERFVAMFDDVPVELEEETEDEKVGEDDDGGGGGGGKNEDKPVSEGELVTQTRPPMMPPSPTIPRLPDPSLPVIMSTEGDITRERVKPPGLPGALSIEPSSGPGSGGGMGTGRGTGMGSGLGTGEGSGTGSGSGSGVGDGTGSGSGSGGRPEPARSGPTTDLRILSKPRPAYTDEARQQNVRGTVILRVTFSANGSIGSVSTVKGLPYGLTENAISAARRIKFEPPMRNGNPYTVSKVVHFNFTIY